MSARRRRFRLGLEAKLVLLLLFVAAVPIVVSAIFIDDISVAAQNVADAEAARLEEALVRAQDAYAEAVDARKDAFRNAATALARDPALRDHCRRGTTPDAHAATLFAADPSLRALVLTLPDGRRFEEDRGGEGLRLLRVEERLAEAPECALLITFGTPAGLLQDLQALGAVLKERRDRARIRRALPRSYGITFITLVGVFMILTVALAIVLSRRTTSRIERLVAATRRVAEGDLDARVELRGNDELADLARAFDEMVVDLEKSRAEIEYLQKIGAWQEVARRLAHEIKNPLTPIQLAVQELHRKYDGDDPRFKKLLDDGHAIVTEEIAGLRRLVDAFREFAKLPRVEKEPLDLALIVEDASREQEMALDPPPEPVVVAADRWLLRRVLVNLVENGRQAGASVVQVSWRFDGKNAVVCVDDDGPGVPASVRERLFDPYVTTKEHGTGLGLAIVKKTILEHGGTISLAPERSPLGGARFEIRLPLA